MKLRLFIFFISAPLALSAQEVVSVSDVVKAALQKSYDIRIQQTVTDAATTDTRYANAAFLPQVNAVGSINRIYNDQELRFSAETREGEIRSENIAASAQLTWTLFDGTRMFIARNQVFETEEQSHLLMKDQMVNTISTVIQNYYDIVRQKQQLKALQEQMSVSEERVKLAERRFQVGTGAKPELLQAKVDYNAQRTQALQQEALIIQLKEQLNSLVDLQLPRDFDVTDTIEINLDLKSEEISADIEQKNFSLQAASSGLRIAGLSVRSQRAQGLPTLDFNAAYNYNQQDNFVQLNPFGPLFNKTQGLTAGFTVSVPILNNFNNRRLVQQSQILLRRQELLLQQQKVVVNTAVRNAFVNYDNARKILLVEEENILLAKENVTIALEVFRRGASTFVELRTAQQSLADAYTRLINARYLAKVAETELLRLNGSLLTDND
jgi:outer membrane protein